MYTTGVRERWDLTACTFGGGGGDATTANLYIAGCWRDLGGARSRRHFYLYISFSTPVALSVRWFYNNNHTLRRHSSIRPRGETIKILPQDHLLVVALNKQIPRSNYTEIHSLLVRSKKPRGDGKLTKIYKLTPVAFNPNVIVVFLIPCFYNLPSVLVFIAAVLDENPGVVWSITLSRFLSLF